METLLRIAKERFEEPNSQIVHLVDNEEANAMLNDLKKYPHAYVLACLMDRQIKAERAWIIPYQISEAVGSFSINTLKEISLDELKKIFNKNRLHRFNNKMAEVFYNAVIDIMSEYRGDAAKIWTDVPSSASVVYRFLEFKGCGRKISTMAANILARQFRIPFSDLYSIDISPDVHIIRVMKRMGLVPRQANNDMIIYKARELNPEFPGIIDFTCWDIGKNWCKSSKPLCNECIVNLECKRVIKND